MVEHVYMPRPGYSMHAVAGNPTSENSVIFEYEGMALKDIHPTNSETKRMFKPMMPPEYYKAEKFGELSLERAMPEGYWPSGINPIIVAIWKTVHSKYKMATIDDIYRALVSEYKILPADRRSRKLVEKQVEWMSKVGGPSFLLRIEGKYRTGVTPNVDIPLIEHHPGYDPTTYEIFNFVRAKGISSYAEIKNYIMNILKWLLDESYFKDLIKKLLKAGNLVEVAKDTYQVGKPLDPHGEITTKT